MRKAWRWETAGVIGEMQGSQVARVGSTSLGIMSKEAEKRG